MKTIVFDFDGVIHIGYKGWKDGSIYGCIDTNIIDYMKTLMNDYYIVISSNRPAKQIVEHLNNLNLGVEFELFEKFVDTYSNRMAEECGYYFKKGFKIAIRLMMECCNDDDIKENEYEL